jgi:hypothetical protein
MKRLLCSLFKTHTGRFLFLVALLLTLVFPVDASSTLAYKNSDEFLFNKALLAEKNNDWLQAAMYLKAYIEREPARLKTYAAHQREVYQHLDYAVRRINQAVGLAEDVRIYQNQLKQCLTTAESRGKFDNPNPPAAPPPLTSLEALTCGGRPGPNQVLLFMHFDYQAPCVMKTIGRYDTAEQIGLPNDSISSLRVGSNVRAVLCMHGGQTGTCETFYADDNNLSNNAIGNDQVTSARVEAR